MRMEELSFMDLMPRGMKISSKSFTFVCLSVFPLFECSTNLKNLGAW